MNKTTYLDTTSGIRLPANKTVDNIAYSDNVTRVMHIIAPFRNNIYDITLSAEPDEYNKALLTFESIIDSTKLIDALPEKAKSDLTPYDSTYGYRIMHPLDLNATDYGNGLVEFNSNELTRGSYDATSSLYYEPLKPLVSLQIRVIPSENAKLYDFVEGDITFAQQNNKNFELIESHQIKVGNYPAHKIIYTDGDYMTITGYILNEKDKNLYVIYYSDEIDIFLNSLPRIEQMISFFELTPNGKSRTYTGFGVGNRPNGIAVNPNTNMIYVANTDSNTVSVLNGSNDEILTNILVDNQPYAVAVNPVKNTVYVTHGGSDSLSVIDGKSNTLVNNIPINAEEPISLAVNPTTDMIYVVDAISRNVSVIDGSINKKVASIATGRDKSVDPSLFMGVGIAVDHIRNRIFVANAATSNINVIDGIDNRILMNISAEDGPYDIAVNPITSTAYIATRYNVATLDLSTNILNPSSYASGEGFNVLTINPFTNMIYVTKTDFNTILAINASNFKDITEIAVDSRPTFLAINHYTEFLYVSNSDSNTVSKINGSDNTLMFGVRFDIDPPNSAVILCNDGKRNNLNFSYNDYVSYSYGTLLKCTAQPKNPLSPLLSSKWSGLVSSEWSISSSIIQSALDVFQNPLNVLASPAGGGIITLSFITAITDGSLSSNPPVELNVTEHGTLYGKFVDLSTKLQETGPYISVGVLASVVAIASIPSVVTKLRKDKGFLLIDIRQSELLSKTEIIGINASVIVGVLIFLSLTEGFDPSEQSQITIITANIVFPFAISVIVAVNDREKFATRLMIAGFINLMISVILIAVMRL
jgi:YVTN family beta-propeller protein